MVNETNPHADIDGRLGLVGRWQRMRSSEDDGVTIEFREGVDVRKYPGLGYGGRFLVANDNGKITWALLTFFKSDGNGENVEYQVVARGIGFADGLREARHTYFGAPGDNGYVFYLPAKMLRWAMDELDEWFDW